MTSVSGGVSEHATKHEDGGTDEIVNALDRQAIPTTVFLPLTVALWQANAATGTAAVTPESLNDNNVGTAVSYDTVDQYSEVDLGDIYAVSQFRMFSEYAHNGDGNFKIQYYDGSAWQDLNTGIATLTVASTWSSWTDLTTHIVTNKIRFVCTALDTKPALPS